MTYKAKRVLPIDALEGDKRIREEYGRAMALITIVEDSLKRIIQEKIKIHREKIENLTLGGLIELATFLPDYLFIDLKKLNSKRCLITHGEVTEIYDTDTEESYNAIVKREDIIKLDLTFLSDISELAGLLAAALDDLLEKYNP